jgi:glycosyltransferase involved in cell wall biosynthesis
MAEPVVKKVLFVTYFWPPSGKASVHWPLFIIKHLASAGWNSTVLTTKVETFSQEDVSLMKEIPSTVSVTKTVAYEPFGLYRKFLRKKADEPLIDSESISQTKQDFRHKASVWIRMNLFVPDARVGWMLSAVPAGRRLLEQNGISAIVSIGPPHSAHLIGKRLAKAAKIPHIPVLIDPWTDIAYYRNFRRSWPTVFIDRAMEKSVLDNASDIVFVTRSMQEDYLKKYPAIEKKSHVLYWGYSEEYFRGTHIAVKGETETIVHAGNMFDFQNPESFWKELSEEHQRGRKIRMRFLGTVSPAVRASIRAFGLESITDFVGFLPYPEMVRELLSASYLLVCPSEPRHVPGKLFEYLRTGKPIIAFGEDNTEVEIILEEAKAGVLLPRNYSGTKVFERLKGLEPDFRRSEQYERKVIAKDLARILDNACSASEQ